MKRNKLIILLIGMVIVLGLVLVVMQGSRKSENNDKKTETQQDLSQEDLRDETENELPIITPSSNKKEEENNTSPSKSNETSKSEGNQEVKFESREEDAAKVNDIKDSGDKEEMQSNENTTLSDKNKMELPFVPVE